MPYQSDSQEVSCAGRLIIDLTALQKNWRQLNERTGNGCECAAVVKANAYGLGAEEAVKALYASGARTFFVATPEEGRLVRAAAPQGTIYVLGGAYSDRGHLYAESSLRPVLGHPDEIAEWAQFCESLGTPLPAAVHVDTGMNRLGLTHAEARDLSRDEETLSKFKLCLVVSHLSCGDDATHPKNQAQLEAFRSAADLFPGIPRSLSNSSGIFLGEDYHFELARPGIALYGGNPIPTRHNPMACVARVEAEVIHLRHVPPGETVGYGAARTTKRPTRIATVNVGYADGMHRLIGSTDGQDGSYASVNGARVPLFGRVSMDMIALDVTDLPANMVQRGTWVELMGPTISVDEVAESAHTISYELLTGLGARYKRTYIGSVQDEEDT
ncbi:alanine racemase [Pseudovibrio sp. SPO723]|uniref:alanine racemase n=1 Tax=Nesiotobacter zosterae TaxID=392721 RepID=UPI0029C1AB50|nr:alanine racemase [Pseudovibrio sp. SPO723]MDX5593760.1 alanine racemase [Pseudovibrio sp. SPO723]